MRISAKRISASGLLLAMLIATLAYQAGGAAMLAGQPTALVTVNLGKVMENLNQRATAEANLRDMAEKLNAEKDKRTAEFTQMDTELQELSKNAASSDDEARQKLQERFALEKLKFEAWKQTAEAKIDIEEALLYKELYQSIKREAAALAKTAGYDVVLVDDSQGELSFKADPRMPRRAQVLQQIAGRRMLYGNEALDITEDLIQRMNNAEKAMGPKPNPNP